MRNGVYRWEEKEMKSRMKLKTKKFNAVGLRWKVTKKKEKDCRQIAVGGGEEGIGGLE